MTGTTVRWTAIVVIATVLDLAGRFLLPFDLMRIMRIEAVLFPVTGAVLLLMVRSEPRAHGWRRAVRWGLIACFLLAGLRAMLWAVGAPPVMANIASPLVVVVSGIALMLRHRRRRQRRGD